MTPTVVNVILCVAVVILSYALIDTMRRLSKALETAESWRILLAIAERQRDIEREKVANLSAGKGARAS